MDASRHWVGSRIKEKKIELKHQLCFLFFEHRCYVRIKMPMHSSEREKVHIYKYWFLEPLWFKGEESWT